MYYVQGKFLFLKFRSKLQILQQFIHDDAADTPNFPGAKATYTESMDFLLPDSYDGIPVYRVMDRQGNVINQSHDPQLSDDELLKMYKVRANIHS